MTRNGTSSSGEGTWLYGEDLGLSLVYVNYVLL